MLDAASWPKGMQVIVRKERPHPGAAALHRHRRAPVHLRCHQHPRRAARRSRTPPSPPGPVRGPDPLRQGHRPAQPPLNGYAQNQIWGEIVALACELTAWMQMLALHGTARRWEPKRLRLRIFTAAVRLVRGGRRIRVRLAQRWPIQRPGKDTAGQWNPPARHGSRAQTLTTVSKRPQAAGHKPASQDHERCRLV